MVVVDRRATGHCGVAENPPNPAGVYEPRTLPELADTTVMRWYRGAGDQVDYRAHLARMAEVFSGQLALDEVYDGEHYFIKATDSQELAEERRRGILDDEEFLAQSGLEKTLDKLRDERLFAKLTRYLAYDNADKTSNHVERENLMRRRAPPTEPRRFRRRERPAHGNPNHEEVLAA